MQELDDTALLREYADLASERAFATLVARHVNQVYSVALRHTRNPQDAGEITQAVFVILAGKARRLGRGVILSGWLHQTARLASLTFIRSQIRRARREQEAHMQTILNENEGAAWEQIAPLLDRALSRLSETDRHAVVLRFFDGKSLREVGAALGTSEDAAKMRVTRALEKLRKIFAGHGVSSTTAVIAGLISTQSVQAAPAGLAQAVTAAALTKGAAAGGSTLTLIKGALKVMAWTKLKTAVVIGAGVLLAAGTTTLTLHEIQEHQPHDWAAPQAEHAWQVPQADFGVFYKAPAQVTMLPTQFKEDGNWCSDGSRGAMGIAQPLSEIIQVAYQKNRLRTVFITDPPTNRYDFMAKLVGPQEAHKNLPTDANWTLALQKKIAQQFGFTGRLQMRATDVLVLQPGPAGIQGFKVSHQMPKGLAMRPTPGNYSYYEQPVSSLTALLEPRFKIPVVDQTGLTEDYDYALKWNEPNPKEPNLPGMKQALLDQLGLELVPTNRPIEMLVVDKVK